MPGFDEALALTCGERDICIPAKYSLNPDTWTRFKEPWHYFYLMWPWDPTLPCVGLQDRNYGADYNRDRAHQTIDDILSFQGSAWMLRKSYWQRLLPNGMDHEHYYYCGEPLEIGLEAWVTGGRVKVIKDVWYAHLWKGSNPETKRKFQRLHRPWNDAMLWATRYWMTHPGFPAVIDRFGPLPGWPADWHDEAMRRLA
jgi:hypothetical protein